MSALADKMNKNPELDKFVNDVMENMYKRLLYGDGYFEDELNHGLGRTENEMYRLFKEAGFKR